MIKKMSNNKQKIELELDQEIKQKIEIISKAFGMDPEEFIKIALLHEIHYISDCITFEHAKEELEFYYKREINMEEIKKLLKKGEK